MNINVVRWEKLVFYEIFVIYCRYVYGFLYIYILDLLIFLNIFEEIESFISEIE